MDVVNKLDELRKQRGWSVNNLAMEAGLTQSTLNNVFVRHAEPKLSTLRALCNALGITLSEFFAEEAPSGDKELLAQIRRLSPQTKAALKEIVSKLKN